MYTKNRADALDVLQDSFIKVFKKIKTFRGEGSLKGWVRRVVALTTINAFNKKKETEKRLFL